MKINKLIVANRGEIAVRVIRTARDLGIPTVAVYSDEDINSQAVKLADEAYSLEGSGFADTYMNPKKILDIAKRAGANAIHPGYGFLSENADFDRECEASGVKWLGPSGDAIDRLGDKVKARKVAEAANVSPVPGISEALESTDTVRKFVSKHGYPVILKRADGGGGHGITVVRTDPELENFFTAHTHDLSFYFIERFVENARHVETQCGRDAHGNFTVYSTRDCSIQRRNQKLIEEAPAPFLSVEVLEQLFTWSKSLFETVEYTGLGTCEYLLETRADGAQSLYFLEVNPRLQVEHTVSEEVSGLDLVAEQIRIAEGQELSKIGNLALEQAHFDGGKVTDGKTSFELRITSEDPKLGMQPTAGVISELDWPMGPGVRLEPGIVLGDTVTTDFDSMVAKVIVTGTDRENALSRTRRALKELNIRGISTPKDLFERVLNEPEFAATEKSGYTVSTKWLENKILPDFASAALTSEKEEEQGSAISGEVLGYEPQVMKEFKIELDGKLTTLKLPESLLSSLSSSSGTPTLVGSTPIKPRPAPAKGRGLSGLLRRGRGGEVDIPINTDPSKIVSPMQGVVVRVTVEEGQKVEEGDLIVILEAMKMEKFITAETAGTVSEIHVADKESVNAGQLLVSLDLG